MPQNITQILDHNLCTGCGTCNGVCPESAIKMIINPNGVFVPQVDSNRCVECGVCLNVCPGESVDIKGLSYEIFGKHASDQIMGNYIACYFTYSKNNTIRYNSASGGLITQLLIFALETGIIDGALVTKMDAKNPLKPQVFIARTVEDIIEASKSKYCPVPVNSLLSEILKSSSTDKFAVVGLPCHIHGIRKAEKINEDLKSKIVLHIGIVCNHTPSFHATEFLLKQLNIKEEDLSKFSYRGKGWPGGISLSLRNEKEMFIPHFSKFYWGTAFNLFFFPHRCLLCGDKLCDLSDISCCDAWLPELANDSCGNSLIIARSKVGNDILNKAFKADILDLKEANVDSVLRSQSVVAVKKRVKASVNLFSSSGKKVPSINQFLPGPALFNYVFALFLYSLNLFLSRKYLWKITTVFTIIVSHSPVKKHTLSKFFMRGN